MGTICTGYPMQIMTVDILGPLPESGVGNIYVLVAGDYFTQWMGGLPYLQPGGGNSGKKT